MSVCPALTVPAVLLPLQRDRLFTSLPLGNAAGTEIRTRLRLRSTVPGANNRLDVASILSWDRGSHAPIPLPGATRRAAARSVHSILCTLSCTLFRP